MPGTVSCPLSAAGRIPASDQSVITAEGFHPFREFLFVPGRNGGLCRVFIEGIGKDLLQKSVSSRLPRIFRKKAGFVQKNKFCRTHIESICGTLCHAVQKEKKGFEGFRQGKEGEQFFFFKEKEIGRLW